MSIAVSLQRYLENKALPFTLHTHLHESGLLNLCLDMGLNPDHLAVPIILTTEKKAALMAVLPLSASLDFDRLRALLRRDFHYMPNNELTYWFVDCEPGAEPPIPEPYSFPCIVERDLFDCHRVFMRGGTHGELISLDQAVFRRIYHGYPKAVISNKSESPSWQNADASTTKQPEAVHKVHECLDQLQRLPALPALALKIIQQVSNPDTSAAELAETIELDPSVAAQIIRYAGSPYYGYRGRLESVQDAITRVLGFELVSHIAFGVASSKAFHITQSGPLGLKAYWRHSLYSAVLCQSLAKKIQRPDWISPAKAYLCGLLHNIGILLIGHLFPEEFELLNQLAERHPDLALHDLERERTLLLKQQYIHIGHDHIGGYVLEKWRLPNEVSDCAYFHNQDAEDILCETEQTIQYVQLIQLANQMLAEHQIGDMGKVNEYDQGLLAALSIDSGDVALVLDEVMKLCMEIDNLADHIAA